MQTLANRRRLIAAGALAPLAALLAHPAARAAGATPGGANLGDAPGAATPAGTGRAADLLAASDAVRNPAGSFSVRTALAEYRAGKLVATSSLAVYARPATDGSGQYRNLVRFVGPARDTGKLMLRNGLDLWFYDPAARTSVRISPQQRLLGQASNGDVMTTRLALDYRIESDAAETVKDAEGAERPTRRLHLVARRDDVPYPVVDYWIDERDARPVMARYFTAENRLLKTAWFRRFQQEAGALRPTETVIIDGLDPGWVTVMQTSEYTPRDIPEDWLQRDYLPRFRGE
ncbi:outer membrane lipoprotein-sorting protein [Derxia gummosa]|uniref:Outer membrane lipoprotein-sorting protein n=1 Tax=Derxia gummosa DSM 723 TaxID=1121388 RepID=A0A8B6XBM3_9BURK|nr:outer membrane lipoprotein-sorting protein [Derxia gummosa]